MKFSILLILLYCLSIIHAKQIKAGVHSCVHISTKLAKIGNGKTTGSCLSCDPTRPTCPSNCQSLIDQMYHVCDDVCLPDEYYYDANYEITGCWSSAKSQIKIATERCGKNLY